MNSRVFAVLIPVAILIGACSSTAAAPTRTYGPSNAPAAPSSPIAVAGPSAAGSTSPTADPTEAPSSSAPAALAGEVPVTMTDAMRFTPELISVKAREPVTFIVTNAGVIVHEFFVGTEPEQAEHAKEMASGGMSHGHDNAVSVEPGETGSLTMTFADAGTCWSGCHEPGHYAAGMQATLTVVD